MPNEWMNAGEAAACLHITRATLYKLVHDGRLPAHRLRGRWYFRPQDIEALFAAAAPAAAAVPFGEAA